MMTVDETLDIADEAWIGRLGDAGRILADEVRRLQAENERIAGCVNTLKVEHAWAIREVKRLTEVNEELRRDAERYRWLRDNEDELSSRILRMVKDGDPGLDSAIDAARSAK